MDPNAPKTARNASAARRQRPRRPPGGLLALAIGVLVAGGVVQLRAARTFEVAKPTENIRATPEGKQIGTLLEGARIEEAGRDGRWVKFRLEGWIWGPSLEGYTPASESTSTAPASATTESAAIDKPADSVRRPRAALNTHLDEIRQLVDDDYGVFYGMRHDRDLSQVQIRLRVRDLEREALELRQMRLQNAVVGILTDVEFESLRVETNRPDGSGEVGVEMAVTAVDDVRRIAGDDIELWRRLTRRSSDGGESWTEVVR